MNNVSEHARNDLAQHTRDEVPDGLHSAMPIP